MNDTRNRDKPASQMTKREEAALRIYTHNEVTVEKAFWLADEFFDYAEYVPELAHAYDEPDFDHEGTP